MGRLFSTSAIRQASNANALKTTPLHTLHKQQKAKMGPFAGFDMPLFYAQGAFAEHLHVRSQAGLFDVSHMVQSVLIGPRATQWLSRLVPTSVHQLTYSGNRFTSSLSVMLNETGGIIDDLMITRKAENEYYIVSNAACRDKDLAWIQEQLQSVEGVHYREIVDHALIALQGPQAANALQALVKDDLSLMYFGQSIHTQANGIDVHVARSGYTGEDGFEISVPSDKSIQLTEGLLADDRIQMTGLAARDSLRLEAGLCLYGNDLDETTTPVEAGLTWLIGKDKREASAFIGAQAVLRQLDPNGSGPTRRRVGLIVEEAPARAGATICDLSGHPIGKVTSGIPSPTAGKNIAMGYVTSGSHRLQTEVTVDVRRALRKATVSRMPFVPAKYYRPM